MSTDPWGTTTGPPIRQTLRKRAARREIEYLGRMDETNHRWKVIGDPKLSDTYGEYAVTGHGTNPRDYSCECQGHGGGQYRRTCSHLVRAIIWWEDNEGEIDAEGEGERASAEGVLAAEGVPSAGSMVEAFGHEDDGGEGYESSDGNGSDPDPTEREIETTEATEDPEEYATNGLTASGLRSLAGELLAEVRTHGTGIFDIEYVNDMTPAAPPLPAQYTEFRESQVDAILETIEAFEDGKKVVFLSAPTGSGKTLIGEVVGRFYGRHTYTCTTKSLQAQILRDFDYAKLLMGRNNYETLDDPEVTCDSCTKNHSEAACWTCGGGGRGHCAYCHPTTLCPYTLEKDAAKKASLSVLNTSYLIREIQRPNSSAFFGRPLFILDEADAIEEQLMGFVEVAIGPGLRRKLGIGLPDLKGKEESWVEWVATDALPAAIRHRDNLKATLFSMSPDPKRMKDLSAAENLVEKLSWLLEPIDEGGEANLSDGWVMNVVGQQGRWKKGGGDDNRNVTIVFKPIKVDRFAREILWKRGGRWLLMSATLISPSQMAEDLGLERDEWDVVEVGSSFPIERRPIVIQGTASVTKKEGEEAMERVAEAIDGIMEAHPDERILVHTVSYPFTRYLRSNLNDPFRLYSYDNAGERQAQLSRFLDDPAGVMLAPSFERGIDLHGDQCRVVVIAKVPYPYLGDQQVNARLRTTGSSGRRWYAAQTIRSICQMTGRAMRSKEDWCVSYLLDTQFSRLYRENRSMFPDWWSDALVWDSNDPKWRKVLRDIHEGNLD